MNNGRQSSPAQPPVDSPTASRQSSQSSRSSSFAPFSGADSGGMTAFAYPSASHTFQPTTSVSMSRPFAANGRRNPGDREFMPIGKPFPYTSTPSTCCTLFRRLPPSSSINSIQSMLVWSNEVTLIKLLSPEESQDPGFLSALVYFKTLDGANDAKKILDGRLNISKDAEMIVEILNPTALTARRFDGTSTAGTNSYIPASAAPGGPSGRLPSQFPTSFHPLDTSGIFPGHEFVPGANTFHQSIFSPQSPIGNHLKQVSDRTHFSSKSLITGDYNDDDDTSDLLKDPVAYAENNVSQGIPFGRRATAPQLPINGMAGLSLNNNHNNHHNHHSHHSHNNHNSHNSHNNHNNSPPGSSSLPPHMNSLSPVSNVPVNNAAGGAGPGNSVTHMNFNHPPGSHHPRPPPANPADQNPPCNTLYVGNLPSDTSEEELKAMFSKQRGYKRLCFRTKSNGPMCFVEFEDVSFATKALHELYGHPLHNSTKGGIRLSFSKNPLGVRSSQVSAQPSSMQQPNANGITNGIANGFSASGPPPGLPIPVPPGLGNRRHNFGSNGNGAASNQQQQFGYPGYPTNSNSPWNTPSYCT